MSENVLRRLLTFFFIHVCLTNRLKLDVTFVFFISLLIVAQHVSGNHVPIIRS